MTPPITLIVLCYNQQQSIRDAVLSSLAQEGEPIEILLSDDASTDASYDLMQALAAAYAGPHTVRCRRNERNLGIGEHYNRAIEAASGELLVTAAGDDISLPQRVRTLAAAWDATGHKADLLASHLIDMDDAGVDQGHIEVGDLAQWTSPEQWTRKRPYVVGAGHAFTRRMHAKFGPFRADLAYEDQVMALRACCMGGGITVAQPLLRYRRGGVSQQEAAITTPQGYLAWNQKKHSRQRALYQQIRSDLATAGRSDLWRGKVRRTHARSVLALQMLRAPAGWGKLGLALRPEGAGLWWSLRTALYFANPRLAAGVQALQRSLRGKP